MSSDPDDASNNPYNEGGTRSNPPRAASNWFCHSCQRDFSSNEILHTPDPACPHCHGDFVEETGESLDDPHEFDRPVFPFPPFLAQSFSQNQPEDGHQHADAGQPGQQRPPGQPPLVFAAPAGQAAGPFSALFFALSQAMNLPQQGQNQPPHQPPRAASAPPLSPGEAARRAAERRAAGLAPDPTEESPTHPSQGPGAQPRSSNQQSSPSASGPYRAGPATFIWTTTNRPPPASYPSSPQQQHQTLPGQTSAQSQQQQQPAGNQGHVRNLASFLQEAFTGGHHSSSNTQNQQQQQNTTNAQAGQQAGTAPQTGEGQGHSDPLMHMLGGLANMFGVPLQGMNSGTHQGQRQGQPGSQTGQNDTPGQPQDGNAQGGTTRTFTYGTPGQGARFVFTFGGPPGDSAAGPIPPAFMPFMMGMGGEGGTPGQMGDYVFSQGALDNIITELMNQAQGRYGPQPATEEIINGLPTFVMTKEMLSSETVTECAVCKDEFEEEDYVMKLPCTHIFHNDCIKPWLERSGTCPICRHQLVPQPEPPAAPGQEGTTTQTSTQGGGRPPFPQGSNPASPSLPRSPAIAEGSSMPGSFPFGNIFSALGNLVTGHSSSNNTGNSTSSSQSAAARSSGDTNNSSHDEQRTQEQQTGQQQGQAQSSTRQEQEEQGQPDLDLDLD